MSSRLFGILSPSQGAALKQIVAMADAPIFLVGGPVRDFLLRRAVLDLDVAVEGDAVGLARRYAAATGGRLTVHDRFHTAKIELPSGEIIDVAECRRETYPEPARLPHVTFGAPVAEDLARRDFTIQAMAYRLNGPGEGEIVDPFGGRDDLKKKVIRILHPNSFVDDPVRVFRAVRYAGRYGFKIEPETARALRLLLKRPELLAIASDRIFDEWKRTFDESRWIEISEAQVRGEILAWLGIRAARDFSPLRRIAVEPKFARWAGILSMYPDTVRGSVAARMPFPKQIKKIFSFSGKVSAVLSALNQKTVRPSRLTRILADWPEEWISVFASRASPAGRRRIAEYVSTWRHILPPLTGDDLKRMGIPPGPAYPKILSAVHAAKIDGEIHSEKDIERIVRRLSSMK